MDVSFENVRNGLVRPSPIPDGSGFLVSGWVLAILGIAIGVFSALAGGGVGSSIGSSLGGGLLSIGLMLLVVGHFTKLFRSLDVRLLQIQVGMLGDRGYLEGTQPPSRPAAVPPRSAERSGADD